MTQTCAFRLSLLPCRREAEVAAVDKRNDRSLYPARLFWSLLLRALPLALATIGGESATTGIAPPPSLPVGGEGSDAVSRK